FKTTRILYCRFSSVWDFVCSFCERHFREDLLSSFGILHRMTRGNQRELARAKNLKKQQEQAKKKGAGESGAALKERKERDAAMMREKQKKAAEKQAAEGGAKK
ncbi:hypothetical protein ACROYT_G001643, partial [Oculina patagonica]